MKILVVGAGAVGGYFGGRLAEAGRDVSFLVRPARADQIRTYGLRIVSPHGDGLLHPNLLLAGEIDRVYDVILLSVKSYALAAAMNDFAAAVGPATMIVPVLNGMRHMERLTDKFPQAVLGGVCMVATDLGTHGEIVQLTETQKLVYGEPGGGVSDRVRLLDHQMQGANFQAQASGHIMFDMWQKWILLASLGSLTCLLRGNVGEIEAAPGGAAISLEILRECSSIAAAEGFAPDEAWTQRIQKSFSTKGSTLTSSMYRDLLKGREVEADQIVGDLLRVGQTHKIATPLLSAAFVNLSIYQAREN